MQFLAAFNKYMNFFKEYAGGGKMMRNCALIVDDVEFNREILSMMLEDEFTVLEAEDGEQAMNIMLERTDDISVLLLDLVMPKMGGIDVLRLMDQNGLRDRFPVLIITGESSAEIEEQCLENGASDFIKKPFNPAVVQRRVKNSVALYTYRFHLEEKVAEQTAQLLDQAEMLKEQNLKLQKMNENTIELLSDVVEMRNLESGTHVRRVKGFTKILAEDIRENYPEYGLTEHTVQNISNASSMHDVGKIMISDAVLTKPGKLTPEEFELMKTHTVHGCDVLERSNHMWEEDYYKLCWQICRHHHEKWDGRGYPDGLSGDDIPLAAQIVAMADCFDALTTERVYKRAYSPDEAYSMIMNDECGKFNPKLKDSFTRCRTKFSSLAEELKGGS